ncbi:MAG: hypothetical protein ACOYEH_06560 [Caldicoprobacterales bacterium]|jgi:hypothetical protein|nr:hypothetical protein [Clostridiales bacterium]
MSRDKKQRSGKSADKRQPAFYNDQLGENAAEHFSNRYENKANRKRK